MKTEFHDKQMADVYGHIYGAFYDFKPDVMRHASAIISKNMDELGIKLDMLPDMNVLNVGTGREALVFHQLGAKSIYHFDVSSKSVKKLQQLSQSDDFRNIYSLQADICESEALGISNVIDLVYLNGVLHHLHATEVAVENITKSLKPSARIYFRIYRSGSLGFFVVDFIRRLISYDDFELTSHMAAEKFGNIEDPAGMYADVVDDFFVPVLNLFDPRQMDDYFVQNGFKNLVEQNFKEYHHGNTGRAGQGWSLYYEFLGGDTSQSNSDGFPKHVDQLHGIVYTEHFINRTVKLMDSILDQSGHMTKESRVELALCLYEASQTYRLEHSATAQENHECLQEILGKFLPGGLK